LGQLGNRVQHALRAFTARDQKALRRAAETYRANPRFDTQEAILQVGVGEAVTSMLQKKGVPGIVERTLVRPPSSQLGPLDKKVRADLNAASPLRDKYATTLDRESAFEKLRARADAAAKAAQDAEARKEAGQTEAREFSQARRYDPDNPWGSAKPAKRPSSSNTKDDSFGEAVASVVIKELKGTTGRRIVRGIFGSLFKSN